MSDDNEKELTLTLTLDEGAILCGLISMGILVMNGEDPVRPLIGLSLMAVKDSRRFRESLFSVKSKVDAFSREAIEQNHVHHPDTADPAKQQALSESITKIAEMLQETTPTNRGLYRKKGDEDEQH